MENAPVKSRLIELLRHAYKDEQELMSSLSAEERAAVSTAEQWSAKEIMAHISFWQDRLIRRLDGWVRGESAAPIEEDEVQQVNSGNSERNRSRGWEEVQAESETVFDRLLVMISQFDEDQLSDPTPIGWYGNRALLAAIVGNSFKHPEEHIVAFYLRRGDRARAREIEEAATEALIAMDNSPEARGVALYNLACFYALNQEPSRAVELLRQALPLRPDLVEWSKQDSDLASLHGLPEYQGLYM